MRIVILFVLLIIAGISLIVIPVDSACGSIPPGSTTIMTKLGIYILKLPAGYQTSDPGQYQSRHHLPHRPQITDAPRP